MAAAQTNVLLLLSILPFLLSSAAPASSSDASNLLLLKESFSNSAALSSWSPSSSPCDSRSPWDGVTCSEGLVIGLRLENMSLSGNINIDALTKLAFVRSVSLYNNSFSGPIPPLNRLNGLKSLYLNRNKFSGLVPDDFFSDMDHLKKLFLSNNEFTGPIPSSVSKVSTMMELHMEGNRFSGQIPAMELPALVVLDLSSNALSGPIPENLAKFGANAFANNPELCGPPLVACVPKDLAASPTPQGSGNSKAIVIAVTVILIVVLVAALVSTTRQKKDDVETLGIEAGETKKNGSTQKDPNVDSTATRKRSAAGKGSGGGGGQKAGPGDIVMVNDNQDVVFLMSDLMKAAAEVLGNGGLGSAYKAVMGNGMTVVVKRLKEMNRVGKETFDVEMRRLGRLKHKNVLPPLAYHYRREEKLLIFEYIPMGSLLYVLHGNRGSEHKALDMRTRMKIVVGVTRGMAHLHTELNSHDIPHGNLKSGNVLLAADFEPLLIDYGYVPMINPSVASQTMFTYKSPESLNHHHVCPKSDVYCLGILILEVLTGKFPSQYLNNTKGGTDVIELSETAIKESRVGELLDPAAEVDPKLVPHIERLVAVGVSCVNSDLELRLTMKEARERIEEIETAARKDIG